MNTNLLLYGIVNKSNLKQCNIRMNTIDVGALLASTGFSTNYEPVQYFSDIVVNGNQIELTGTVHNYIRAYQNCADDDRYDIRTYTVSSNEQCIHTDDSRIVDKNELGTLLDNLRTPNFCLIGENRIVYGTFIKVRDCYSVECTEVNLHQN